MDASHLISKANLWEERDEVSKKKYGTVNNTLRQARAKKEKKVASSLSKRAIRRLCSLIWAKNRSTVWRVL